jgi:hypothetical protein
MGWGRHNTQIIRVSLHVTVIVAVQGRGSICDVGIAARAAAARFFFDAQGLLCDERRHPWCAVFWYSGQRDRFDGKRWTRHSSSGPIA